MKTIRDRVYWQVLMKVGYQIGNQVGNQVYVQVCDQVDDQVLNPRYNEIFWLIYKWKSVSKFLI